MLDEERAYYEERLQDWLGAYAGRFVLVKGRTLLGVYDTIDEALAEGARRYGRGPFLVRQVLASQPVFSAPALSLGILRADLPHPVPRAGTNP